MDDLKKAAAARALSFVQSGMTVGLGTGSTAAHFVDLLGERVAGGLSITGVPTSEATARQAAARAIPLTTLDECPQLDLVVDGADEVDGAYRLIKGRGGALLREKIVAASAKRMVVIVDGGKMVETLGLAPLPVEVVPFGLASTRRRIEAAAAQVGCTGPITLRGSGGHAFVTDGGHWILDCSFGTIPDAPRLAAALAATPGVVEHGLFLDLATTVIVARPDGIAVLGSPD